MESGVVQLLTSVNHDVDHFVINHSLLTTSNIIIVGQCDKYHYNKCRYCDCMHVYASSNYLLTVLLMTLCMCMTVHSLHSLMFVTNLQ